jgi:SnoaL-like protein
MDANEYRDYIDCFNRNDFDGFSKRYADDVVFELGDKKKIVGRAAIADFYRDVKAKVRETIEILSITTQGDTLAAHVRTEFYGLVDWPDFIAGRLMKGEKIVTESLAYYYLKDGKFARILGARFRTL